VFKKHFNQTPTEYVNELRLNYSANMLITTDENIPYISMDSGYENLSHYYHLFKNKFGMTTKEFRNQNRANIIPA
jgi:AraC family cel operon transcriptional repressor